MGLIRRRPAAGVVVLVLIVAVVGVVLEGFDFIAAPLPVPRFWAAMGMTTNLVLATIAMVLVYRNLHRYEEQWTWQERGFSRGTFLIIFAGSIGYFARAFTDPSATLGTPVYTIGALWLIWASVRSPERFEENSDGRPS